MFSEKRSLAGQLKLPQRRNPLRVQYLLRARFYPPRLLKKVLFGQAGSRILGALARVAGGGLSRRGLRRRITYPGEKNCASFCAPSPSKPVAAGSIGLGNKSPVLSRRLNTIANR